MHHDFKIKNDVLIKYQGSGGAVVIPDRVITKKLGWYRNSAITSIGDRAFHHCENLISVNIPDSITSIEHMTFFGCKSLTSIRIPDNVTSIGYNAFYDCENLTSVNIPPSVTTIGDMVFASCINLNHIILPDSVTSIGDRVFEYCTNLTNITYSGMAFTLDKINIDLADSLLAVCINKNYSIDKYPHEKYHLIFQMFTTGIDTEGTYDYIKQNFTVMFQYLIDKEDITLIQKVLATGEFLTNRNINQMIQYAIDHKKYESQVILTNYKLQKDWYDDEKDIKKKFSL